MSIKIGQIIAAIKGAKGDDLKALKAALKAQGIDTVSDKGTGTSGSGFGSKMFNDMSAATSHYTTELIKAAKSTDDLLNPLSAAVDQIRLFRQENEEFVKSGYSGQMFNFRESLQAVAEESYKLTGNYKAFGKVTSAFRDNFKALGFVSETFRQSIQKTGVALTQAGFDMGDFSKIVDSATMAFDKSEGQVNDIAATLVRASKDFAIAPKELTENFQYAQKNFAYNTERFMGNFLQLQKMSRTTGVEFGKLAASFGENMDTFEGSAQMAGQLNQILGKSMFNSIDLLNKTEAERAATIKQGILERFGGRVGDLQKFELKAIGKSLNMSAEETRRFLRGEAPKAAKDMEKLKKKSPAEIASANLGTELEGLQKSVDSFRRPTERAFIGMGGKALKAAKSLLGLKGSVDEATDAISKKLIGITEVAGFSKDPTQNLSDKGALGALMAGAAGGSVAKAAAPDFLVKMFGKDAVKDAGQALAFRAFLATDAGKADSKDRRSKLGLPGGVDPVKAPTVSTAAPTVRTPAVPKPPSPSLPTGVNADKLEVKVTNANLYFNGKLTATGEVVPGPNP